MLDVWLARLNSLNKIAAWPFQFGPVGARARVAAMLAARENGFNLAAYQEIYPDVGAVHPLVHFATIGQFEGRVIDGNARSSIETSQKSDLLRALSFRAPRCPSGDSPSGDRVDIIIPFYNRRNSVASAVGSALEQTADVTVYAIDDGSEDGGSKLLKEEFKTELNAGRLVIISQSNKGAAAARNKGLAAGCGDWVAYVDSDNVLEPDHVKQLLAAAHRAGAAMAYGGWRSGDNDQHCAIQYDRTALLKANFIDLNTLIHHRSLYDTLGGFDERLHRLQDWDLVLRYGRIAAPAASSQISVVREIGNDSITTTVDVSPSFRQVRENHICELMAMGLGPRLVFGSQAALIGEDEQLRAAGLKVEFGSLSDALLRFRRGIPGVLHVLTREEARTFRADRTPYFCLIKNTDGPLSGKHLNLANANEGPAGWTMDTGTSLTSGLAMSGSIN